jgi:hypothetical protein
MNSARALRLAPLAFVISATVMVSGCSGGAKTAASATAADSAAPAGDTAAGTAATPVKATGGGKFCTELAQAMNTSRASTPGTDAKAQILAARAATDQIVNTAPSAIKSDVRVLVAASNVMYDALAKVDYDYSKLTAADTAGLSAPDVAAAEQHLLAYVKGTCGIDLTGGASGAAALASAGAAADSGGTDTAASGSSGADGGSACDLATVAEVSAGAGKPMKLTGGAGTICAYGAVDDPSYFMYVQIYDDQPSMASMTQIESGSDHLAGLGDDAFWNGTAGVVFVRKGNRGFSFALPSLANLTSDPSAIKSKMVTLATTAAAGF